MNFRHFDEKPYPNLGAFLVFEAFDTTGPPMDTTSGHADRTGTNPYPILEETDENDTFS